MAAPLAVGVTSDAELLDLWLRKWMPPQSAMMMARAELPAGFSLRDVWEVPIGAPALQAMVRTAHYECVALHNSGVVEAQQSSEEFLQSESVIYRFVRSGEDKSIDLRPLVREIAVQPGPDNACRVSLVVAIGQDGSARPDHVLSVLGFVLPAVSIHRAALLFEDSGFDAGGG